MRSRHGLGFVAALAACSGPTRQPPRDDVGVPPTTDVGDAGSDGALDRAQPDGACAAGRVSCLDTRTALRCSADGASLARTQCQAPAGVCADGLGCRLCVPASTRCVEGDALGVQRCRADGSGWEDAPRCAVDARQTCVDGACVDRCVEGALDGSHLGCTFWPTVTPNAGLDPMFEFAVALVNPQSYRVAVTISGGALTAPREVALAPGAAEFVRLPWVLPLVQLNPMCVRQMGTCVATTMATSALARGGAYRVQADGPIAAYQFNSHASSLNDAYYSYTNDASLLLPQGALTRRYTVSTFPDLGSMVPVSGAYGGFVSVVGTTREPARVTVRVTGRVRGGRDVAPLLPAATATFMLEQGDVVELVGAGDGDLTGTTVESSQPVAVFVGHDCARVPSDRVACDHLEEQLLPDDAWGREYVVSALRDRGPTVPQVVRVVSRVDGNAVTFDPVDIRAPVTLNRGEVVQVEATRSFRVRGSGALLVTHFMVGQGPTMSGLNAGDPSMAQAVPVTRYRDRYDFFVPSTFRQNFINVVAPAGADVTLDGQPLSGPAEPLGDLVVTSVPVMEGPHRLRSAAGRGVGLEVYGVAPYTSYMYPGGIDLRPSAP